MTIDVIVQCIEEKFPPPQSHRSKLELIQPSPCVAPPDRFQQYIYSSHSHIVKCLLYSTVEIVIMHNPIRKF